MPCWETWLHMADDRDKAGVLRLEKYHGQGNDFLILIDPDGAFAVDGSVARALCDRHRGVGADGLILVGAGPTMTLWNADGSRAEMSGNGIRCMVLALADAGSPDVVGGEVDVATDAGARLVHLHGRDATVDMGEVMVTNGEHGTLLVDVGNPHAVLEVQDPYDHDLAREARRFPGRNVELVSVGPGPDEITMRVWERGVGETLACGTGACAAAAAASRWGFGAPRLRVNQPGGAVTVDLDSDGRATLSGPAEHVCSVEVPWTR